MKAHWVLFRGAAFWALITTAVAAYGDTLAEVEANDPIGFAQALHSSNGEVVVPGIIGKIKGTTNDVDFYSFTANQGDVLTIDIDNGIGGQQSIDLYLAVFDPRNGYKILRENDDAGWPIDAGSISPWDPRIDNFVAPATGTYVIGVTSASRPFLDGGTVMNTAMFGGNGDYTLVVTGVRPAIKQISIEVKPGDDRLAPINPKARGKVPVAILSSRSFDATSVDESSLTFGETGNESSLSFCEPEARDVNADGLPDKVCHFDNQASDFAQGDLEGVMKGKTSDGTAFEGHGRLKVVPGKPSK